jgi:hypothetical protein
VSRHSTRSISSRAARSACVTTGVAGFATADVAVAVVAAVAAVFAVVAAGFVVVAAVFAVAATVFAVAATVHAIVDAALTVVVADIMRVGTSPGQAAMTRTPSGARSAAARRVKALRHALDNLYAGSGP